MIEIDQILRQRQIRWEQYWSTGPIAKSYCVSREPIYVFIVYLIRIIDQAHHFKNQVTTAMFSFLVNSTFVYVN